VTNSQEKCIVRERKRQNMGVVRQRMCVREGNGKFRECEKERPGVEVWGGYG